MTSQGRSAFPDDLILVTGGAGFIGSNFVRHVLQASPSVRVVNMDKLTYAGDRRNLEEIPDPSRHEFVQADIGDARRVGEVLRDLPIRALVNLAAETHVDRSLYDPAVFVQTNLIGVQVLLETARRVWFDERGWGQGECRFIQVSTDEVYGSLDPTEPAPSPGAPYRPTSPYAASKAGADHLARAWFRTYGLPVIVTNCTNNYGPFQHPEKLIPYILASALEGRDLPVYGDGLNVRDWLYVEDHCRGLLRVLERGVPGATYHFASGVGTENLSLVRQICQLLDAGLPEAGGRSRAERIRFVADRPGHDRRYALNIESTREALGWEPATLLEEGLGRTVSWFLEHRDWVGQIQGTPEFQDWVVRNYTNRSRPGAPADPASDRGGSV